MSLMRQIRSCFSSAFIPAEGCCPWDWTALADGLELLVQRRVLNPLAYATARPRPGRVNMVERLGHEADERRRRPPACPSPVNPEPGTRNREPAAKPPLVEERDREAGRLSQASSSRSIGPEGAAIAVPRPAPAAPAEAEDEPEVELTDKAQQWIRERLRSRSSSSDQDSRSRRRDCVDPAVAAEARAAGLLEFDARCPDASAEERARFVEELEDIVGSGGRAWQAVELAIEAARPSLRGNRLDG